MNMNIFNVEQELESLDICQPPLEIIDTDHSVMLIRSPDKGEKVKKIDRPTLRKGREHWRHFGFIIICDVPVGSPAGTPGI